MRTFEEKMNKMIFGDEIMAAIENYEVKTLYCSPEFNKEIKLKIEKEQLNFEIIIIEILYSNESLETIDPSDLGKELIKHYSGAIGIKYY
jgi:hypothetical protein